MPTRLAGTAASSASSGASTCHPLPLSRMRPLRTRWSIAVSRNSGLPFVIRCNRSEIDQTQLAELPVEILRHVLEGQRLQPEFGRIRAGQIELSPPQWRGRRRRLNRSDGGKKQNLGRIAPLAETCPGHPSSLRRPIGDPIHTTSVVSSASARAR